MEKVVNNSNECYTDKKYCEIIMDNCPYQTNISASDVAKQIINFRISLHSPITNLFLQFLLYYVQAFSISMNRGPAFFEDIINTKHGPIVEAVYNRYIFYMNRKIEDSQSITKPLSSNVLELIEQIVQDTVLFTRIDFDNYVKKEAPWLLTPFFDSINYELLIAEFEYKDVKKYFRGGKNDISRTLKWNWE